MTETENLKLKKPDYTDTADIADINANMDIIDENLGRVTVPTYTDSDNKKYTDINGMHIRTDNAIYVKGGIKIVASDPCSDGENLTEEDVSGAAASQNVLAKIDENGNAVFKQIDASGIDADRVYTDELVVDSTALKRLAIHFSQAKGALYTDNSSYNASDGSRKFILGVYKNTPSIDGNKMPETLPNAGVVTRIASDTNGSDTYIELYGHNILCRTYNSVFKAATIKADTIRAGGELKIGNMSVAELIEAKADGTHSHMLTDDKITGVLPVAKGGTGASTVVSARTNLGLGTAATRGVATTVVSGNTNLITSGAVYSAINSLNINNRTHIVIASYNTQNSLKANADYICTSTNASSVLKTAINAVAKGGTVELLDGTYNLQYYEDAIELNKDVTIKGAGHTTVINQPCDEGAGEAKPIFIISGQDVKLKGMMLCDKDISSPVAMIEQQAHGAIYNEVFFIFNASETSSHGACVSGSKDCSYTRIQNCRVYKGFNNSEIVMFDFSSCTSFGGVIGANISSGYNNISVKFASEGQKNNTAVYGHKAIDLLIK